MGQDKIQSFLTQVSSLLEERQVVADKEGLSHYCYDATEMRFAPDIVLLPENVEEVSGIMKLAYRMEMPVTPQGGRTGLSGGALPVRHGAVLSLIRMNKIIAIDEKNMQVVVEPGVISADLQEALRERNLFFPPDPSSTVESTVGGNVAENAGYTRAVKYGVTRDYVLGLEAVLPGGEIINAGGRTVKNVTGYDLTALLTGSEGTLAVITKIIFKVLPRPMYRRTCIIYVDDLIVAARFVASVFEKGIVPCAIEFMDDVTINCVGDYLPGAEFLRRDAAALVLVEIDGNHEGAVNEEAGHILELARSMKGVIESRLALDDREGEKLWRIRREALPALKAKGKDHLEADVVVPRYELPFLVRAIRESEAGKSVKVATFGHGGDGNLHVTIQYRKKNFAETEEAHELLGEIYRKTVSMGGKLTGEHGVGITAKNYMNLQMSRTELELLKRVKNAFDPKGLLNPGKIFPDSDTPDGEKI
ncbi:MAG TPA: FAD-linked oxidase C-terminal domain-containing protein [Syntrophorhabdaceae bacterium]|jgi:glycolate oxidase